MEATLAVSMIQVLALCSALWLSGQRRLLHRGLPYLVSVAVGVLLATALLHILPEAVAAVGNRPRLWLIFTGTIFALFCMERIFAASTGHPIESDVQAEDDCGDRHHHSSRPLGLVFGGVLHSVVDGVSVAAAFSVGRQIGWLTAAAITLHEVPHRMSDFALLTHLHVAKRRAVQMLIVIGLAGVGGALLVRLAGPAASGTAWLLPMSAASFVYIALVNLMPELMEQLPLRSVLLQLLAMLAGAALAGLLLRLPGS